MSALSIHRCEREKCRLRAPHAERALHCQINLLTSRLNEQQRRWFVALEAMRLGRGGLQLLAHLSTTPTQGHAVSRPAVSRLLRQLGYSPKVNARRCEARSSPAKRDAQFDHIAAERARLAAAGNPIISVDTKKMELIGNYRNAGRAWCKTP